MRPQQGCRLVNGAQSKGMQVGLLDIYLPDRQNLYDLNEDLVSSFAFALPSKRSPKRSRSLRYPTATRTVDTHRKRRHVLGKTSTD